MKISQSKDILRLFPVRKSAKQKEAFRTAAMEYLSGLGYPVTVEKGSLGARNLVIGDPETAKYLITAHYDTCARMIVPNLITPCSFTLFMLYQIFVAILLIVPAVIAAIGVGMLFHSFWVGYDVGLVLMVAVILLVMVGPSNPSNVNDNSSGVIAVMEIARSLPANMRDKVCFVLFDLEEAGLFGSVSYRSKHKKATNNQLVLNMDCVGEGDEIYFFPTAKLKRKKEMLKEFQPILGVHGKKRITLQTKGFSVYPSDQVQFPYGVGICALRKGKLGLYLSRIHTPKDTILDETNINILRAAIITMISSNAVQ